VLFRSCACVCVCGGGLVLLCQQQAWQAPRNRPPPSAPPDTLLTHPCSGHPTARPLHPHMSLRDSFVSIGYTAAAKMFSSTTRVCPSTSNGQVAGFLNPVMARCSSPYLVVAGGLMRLWLLTP
jgi:hypothetical protein